MKFGVVLPYTDAGSVAEIARDAERAGWDGVFVADALWGIDPWIADRDCDAHGADPVRNDAHPGVPATAVEARQPL
jgi:alkanesulfonate monooxygenase SsuD/methylene tetrahydromethanopterin reductase-like flavin-dependent oxidoreductase (luciferase family)